MGRWFKTSRSGRSQTHIDRIEVFSDVEAPKSIKFKDSKYNMNDGVVDTDGEGHRFPTHIPIAESRDDTTSSSFPRNSGSPERFDYVDRGFANARGKDRREGTIVPRTTRRAKTKKSRAFRFGT